MSYKQLCIELINELQGYKVAHPEHDTELIDRARLVVNNPPEAPEAPIWYGADEAFAWQAGWREANG